MVSKERQAKMTPAEKAAQRTKANIAAKERLAKLTDTEKATLREKAREGSAKRRANMTPEERAAQNEKTNIAARERIAKMTPEEKKIFKENAKAKAKAKIEAMSPQEKSAHNAEAQTRAKERMDAMTPEERTVVADKRIEQANKRVAAMTDAERAAWRKQRRDAANARNQVKVTDMLKHYHSTGGDTKQVAKLLKSFFKDMDKMNAEKRGEVVGIMSKVDNALDYILYLRIASMLTNPWSQLTNVSSNVSMVGAGVSDLVFERALGALGATTRVGAGDITAHLKGLASGATAALANMSHNTRARLAGNYDDVVSVFKHDSSSKIADFSSGMNLQATSKNTGPIGNVGNLMKYAAEGKIGVDTMSATDQFFKSVNYFGHMYQEASASARALGLKGAARKAHMDKFVSDSSTNLVSHNTGLEHAQYRTFTAKRDGMLESIEYLARGKDNRGLNKVSKLFVPFLGTLLNMSRETLRYTPVAGAMLKPIGGKVKGAGAFAAMTSGEQLTRKMATQATAFSSLALGLMGAEELGLEIVGDYSRKANGKLLNESGYIAGSVKTANHTYKLDRGNPFFATLIGLSDLRRIFKHYIYNADDDHFTNEQMHDKYMEGTAKVLDVMINTFEPKFITDASSAFADYAHTGSSAGLKHIVTSMPATFISYNGGLRAFHKDENRKILAGPTGLGTWEAASMAKIQAVVDPDDTLSEAAADIMEPINSHMAQVIRDLFPRGLRDQVNILGNADPNSEGIFSRKALTNNKVLKELVKLTRADKYMASSVDVDELKLSSVPRRGTYRTSQGTKSYVLKDMEEYYKLKMAVAGKDANGKAIFDMTLEETLSEIFDTDSYKELGAGNTGTGHSLRVNMIKRVISTYRRAGMLYLLDGERMDNYEIMLEAMSLRVEEDLRTIEEGDILWQ